MSTIKSSDEHLTLNADGSSKDIKFQANGVEKASISSAGAFTSTTIDATKLTGNLPAINGSALTNLPAASQLDHSGTKKFEATASGATLTGTAGTSPILELNNADTEDNDTGRETTLRFTGKRSGGEDVVNAQISGHHQGNSESSTINKQLLPIFFFFSPPTVPGLIVTYSLIRLLSPISRLVTSPLYFKSCGSFPIEENG